MLIWQVFNTQDRKHVFLLYYSYIQNTSQASSKKGFVITISQMVDLVLISKRSGISMKNK